MKDIVYKKYYKIWKTKYSVYVKKKRVRFINDVMSGRLFDQAWLDGKNILEIGSAHGSDFIQFFKHPNLKITAVDIIDYDIKQDNVTFLKADAEKLPFDDKHFDFCVSFGVLEHIQPIEKLCNVISEIDRVSKSYAMIVPCISTFFEPHTADFLWQLRSSGNKRVYSRLNYYSDEAWMQFQGFDGASVKRYSYIPFLIRNTLIYKLE